MTAQIIDFLKYKKEREEKLWNPPAGFKRSDSPMDITIEFTPNYEEWIGNQDYEPVDQNPLLLSLMFGEILKNLIEDEECAEEILLNNSMIFEEDKE